jgi:hypothetical protein
MNTLTYANCEDEFTRCFLQFWADRTPVVLKNQVPRQMPDEVKSFVYFTVSKNASRQDSFGPDKARVFLRIGRIFAELYVQTGLVTGLLNEHVASIVEYYERSEHSPLRVARVLQFDLPDGAHRRASITGDGRWYGTQVNVQWAFDEYK